LTTAEYCVSVWFNSGHEQLNNAIRMISDTVPS
jgi:hypothetical protein